MDHPCSELLAAAGLAVDEYGRLALGEAIDHAAHLLHRRRFAEQLVARRGLRLLRHLERLLHQRPQLLERHRFREVVERAGLQCRHGVLGTPERRDDGNGHVERLLRDVLDDAEPFAVGEIPVGQAEVVRVAIEHPYRLADGLGARRIESHSRQRHFEQLEQIRLVIDDQHFGLTTGFSRHGIEL